MRKLRAGTFEGSTADDLIRAVDKQISKKFPPHVRAEVTQGLILSLLEGTLYFIDVKAAAKKATADYWRMENYGPLSIDAPLPGTSNLTIADTLSNDTARF